MPGIRPPDELLEDGEIGEVEEDVGDELGALPALGAAAAAGEGDFVDVCTTEVDGRWLGWLGAPGLDFLGAAEVIGGADFSLTTCDDDGSSLIWLAVLLGFK